MSEILPSYFDTHAHLTECPIDRRLFDSHVQCLSVATQPSDWQATLDLAKPSPTIYPALGLHPWFLLPNSIETDLVHLRQLVSYNRVEIKAIGEIGLDFYPNILASKALQLDALNQQLALASQYQLPVSLHCRKAYNELYQVLKPYSLKGVLHGFASSPQMARQFSALDYKIGLGPILLNPKAHRYHQLARELPLECLVLESDAPFYQLNMAWPDIILAVAQKIAELRRISLQQILDTTRKNAQEIFQ